MVQGATESLLLRLGLIEVGGVAQEEVLHWEVFEVLLEEQKGHAVAAAGYTSEYIHQCRTVLNALLRRLHHIHII